MKKPLLISLTALAVLGITTATTLYAQTTTGSSVIARMKAAAAAFTLSADLNPGQTGLTSAPLTGKKTGDVLTAGEYNRLLELISQGSANGCSSTSGNVYDSGWVDFQGNPVQTLTHNLGTMDTVVFMEMKSDKDYGIAHSVPITLQPNKAHFAYGNFYTKWYNKTENTISVTTANNIETMSDRYVRVVMIKTSALTSGCGGFSNGPAFYRCTNAQSLDVNNAPCYGAARNGGAGTDKYRVVSCTDNDGTRSYTMSSILNFGQLVTNKWAVSVNGGTIECDDGTVLVMDIQGGGGDSPSCPTGFTLIGDGGRGSFCISTASETPTTYAGAMEVCYQKNAEICGNAEWYSACRANETAKVALQGMGGSNMEMTFTGAYNYTVMAMGSGGGQTYAGYFINGSKCETKGYMLDARNNNAYRCCIK